MIEPSHRRDAGGGLTISPSPRRRGIERFFSRVSIIGIGETTETAPSQGLHRYCQPGAFVASYLALSKERYESLETLDTRPTLSALRRSAIAWWSVHERFGANRTYCAARARSREGVG